MSNVVIEFTPVWILIGNLLTIYRQYMAPYLCIYIEFSCIGPGERAFVCVHAFAIDLHVIINVLDATELRLVILT